MLQTGAVGLDMRGDFVTFIKIEHAFNEVHFWILVLMTAWKSRDS